MGFGAVRFVECATCGAPVVWLSSWGLSEPRPLSVASDGRGRIVVDQETGRYRHALPADGAAARFELHWPCPTLPVVRSAPHAAGRRPSTLPVGVVAHTHWDREWYLPFESFRVRLVRVLDEVLDVLDADPAFSAFTLDGHTALVDDYLEARPANEARLIRHVRAGRLLPGPWEVLADQFLVSGETLVRNLRRGVARCAELGGMLRAGYLPDQFGQGAQTPQMLRLAGIGHAVVFRGLPDEVTGATSFWWEAPDGSRVRAEGLPGGYTHAHELGSDPKLLVARTHDWEAALGSSRVGDLLLMHGSDHEPVQPGLPALLAAANAEQGDFRFSIRRLDDHLEHQPVAGLPTWRGELRASGHATVTMGVVSNRVDLRLATAAAERALERRAEPLCALVLADGEYPGALLDVAWRRLIANSAHDSISACCPDEVVREVLGRAITACQIADGLASGALSRLAADAPVPAGTPLVVNTIARTRGGAVEVHMSAPGDGPFHLTADGAPLPTQSLDRTGEKELGAAVAPGQKEVLVALVGPDRFAGRPLATWERRVDGGSLKLTLHRAAEGHPGVDLAGLRRLLEGWEAPIELMLLAPPRAATLVSVPDVPSFGWRALEVRPGPGPRTQVAAGPGWVANEHIHVEADPVDGTLSITTRDGLRLDGLGRLVDGADVGDTYSWSPVGQEVLVDRPEWVEVAQGEAGPVRASLTLALRYLLPEQAVGTGPHSRRSLRRVPVEMTTLVEVVTGEPFVRLTVTVDNRVRDHRLRAHFPLPAPVTSSHADTAMAVVERGLTVRGNALEAALPTFPATRFVDCSDGRVGLAVLHDAVSEYEVVAGGTEVAVTLLRAVGQLSVPDGLIRRSAAGPVVPLDDAQMLAPVVRRLALLPHRGDWEEAGVWRAADDFLLPFDVLAAGGAGSGPAPGAAPAPAPTKPASGPRPPVAFDGRLAVDGAEVTACARVAGEIELRLLRAASTGGRVRVTLGGAPARGRVVDLTGAEVAPFDGSADVRPWQILTVRIPA